MRDPLPRFAYCHAAEPDGRPSDCSRGLGGLDAAHLRGGGESTEFVHVPRDFDQAALPTHGRFCHDVPGLESQKFGSFGTERCAPRAIKSTDGKQLTPTYSTF